MNLKPKYNVVIQIHTFPGRLHFYFARPIDWELMKEIKSLERNEGFEFVQIVGMTNQPWCLNFPPNYDAFDVALYMEELLRSHGHNDLLFRVDVMGATNESLTVDELSRSN